MIRFTVFGQPVPWKRTRGQGNARYKDPRLRVYQDAVALNCRSKVGGSLPLMGALGMALVFRNKDRRIRDIDNLAKCIQDALNGVLYQDDSQIVSLLTHKLYACPEPAVDVWCWMTNPDIQFMQVAEVAALLARED